MRTILFIFALMIGAANARAAEMLVLPGKDDFKLILVSGEFLAGDDQKFKNLAITVDQAVVVLEGPGGLAYVGMEIGRTIAIKGFLTLVPERTICASSCALAWLAGSSRAFYPTSLIGFHAVHTTQSGQSDISSAGNALVGSYLQQLGLNSRTIVYVTETQPNSMRWLTAADAQAIGLDVLAMGVEEIETSRHKIEPNYPEAETEEDSAKLPDFVSPVEEDSSGSATTGWQILQYADLPGFDLPGMPLAANSAMLCQTHCEANDRCVAFTYNVKYQACFLKRAVMEAYQFTGAISGFHSSQSHVARVGKDYGPGLQFQTNKGMEVVGTPFGRLAGVNLAWCQDQCILNQHCMAFNFYTSGDCLFLQNRNPTRANPLASFGIKLQ